MRKAREADNSESPDGIDIPEELNSRRERHAKPPVMGIGNCELRACGKPEGMAEAESRVSGKRVKASLEEVAERIETFLSE